MSYHLLIIDDDDDQLLVLRTFLEQLGNRVTVVSSAGAALELLPLNSFDVLVCDVMMPYEDGMSFIEAIRHNPQYADLPVIMVTAAREDLAEGLIQSGADMFCLKRNVRACLPQMIEELMQKRRAQLSG